MLTSYDTYRHLTSCRYAVAPICGVAVRRGSYIYPRRAWQIFEWRFEWIRMTTT